MTRMGIDFTIVTARRIYEFPVDKVRLSALSTPVVQARLREAFAFQTSSSSTPFPGAGAAAAAQFAVLLTWGSYTAANGALAPIRFVQFGPTQMIVDVVGPSSIVELVCQELVTVLTSVELVVGEPILGEPSGVRDYSELTFAAGFDLMRMLRPEIRGVLAAQLASELIGREVVPGLTFQSVPGDTVYSGPAGAEQYVLQVRAGSRPGDHVVFSAAPLSTDAHSQYVDALVEATLRSG